MTQAVLNTASARPPLPRYMTVSRTSREFGPTRPTIYKAIRNGDLVAYKNGQLTMLETAAVERWIQSWPKFANATGEQAAIS
jgi:excisionase family DNA binding protein